MDNIDDLKAQIAELKIVVDKHKAKHNKNCLNYYHKHKEELSEKRKSKYAEDAEYAEKIRQKRRERYHLGKNNIIQEKS
jgi:hypothetical protein